MNEHRSGTDERRPNPRQTTRRRIDGRPEPHRRATSARPTTARPHHANGTPSRSAYRRPTNRNGIYVQQGYSHRRPSRFPYILGGLGVIVAVVLAVSIAGALTGGTSSNSDGTAPLDVSEHTTQQPTTLTVSFAGDCTLGTDEGFDQSHSFNAVYDSVNDPSYFFSKVAGIFGSDDLTVVNMEGTLTNRTTRADKTFAFKGPAEYANILVKGNVETASLANNHSHDYGDTSYTDTISALEDAGIGTFGYDRICYRDVKGIKVALIGTYELADGMGIQNELESNIKTAKDQGAQLTIVFFHWGSEKETVPDETQVSLGHSAIDAGADLVIGSHPHVIQGYEKYQGRYIVYSLGNFCFGGNANPSDTDAMIFQQTFTVTGSDIATDDAISIIPVSITSSDSGNNYQPMPLEGDEKARVEKKIQKSTDSIAEVSAHVQEATSSDNA